MSMPALLQQLIGQTISYEQRPTKKNSRLIKTTACELLKRTGYKTRTATELAKKIIEQVQ